MATCLLRAQSNPGWSPLPAARDERADAFAEWMTECLEAETSEHAWSCTALSCAWLRPPGSEERYLFVSFGQVLEQIRDGTLP